MNLLQLVLALRRYGNRSWLPWLLSISIELTTRILSSYYYNKRIPGGFRWASSLEKEEQKRRIRQFFFYILRGPFYEKFTKYYIIFFFPLLTVTIGSCIYCLIFQPPFFFFSPGIDLGSIIFARRLVTNQFCHYLEVFSEIINHCGRIYISTVSVAPIYSLSYFCSLHYNSLILPFYLFKIFSSIIMMGMYNKPFFFDLLLLDTNTHTYTYHKKICINLKLSK